MKLLRLYVVFFLLVAGSCREAVKEKETVNFYETELFKEVQMKGIFKDSKTFVDLVPNGTYNEVAALYEKEKNTSDFDLKQFVEDNFTDQSMTALNFETDTTKTMYEHISSMWEKLTRGPDIALENSSRIALPYKYIVPGGRFQEIYYWDSYFTMEGLLVDNQRELAKNMVDNFTYLIDTIGFIPNGTRDYYLTRSQPPFYTLMVDALTGDDTEAFKEYFPTILKEYDFWMQGTKDLAAATGVSKNVVQMKGEEALNRYWDSGSTPRPESYKEDHHLASDLTTEEQKIELYTNMRSGAASGWDFSSRWYTEEGNFGSTKTADILALDLNCLLYFMETAIAKRYNLMGDDTAATKFLEKAEKRKSAIQRLFWDAETNYFYDVNFVNESFSRSPTLAATFPLYFNIATEEQADKVKEKLMNEFLKDGGLVTTLEHSGQQWDAPNGWAPLQWIGVHGLLNYGYEEEAKTIMTRWLALNERVYKNTGKMMEKYNVEDITLLSGGGEYETQDGFGWTNGVALGFKKMLSEMEVGAKVHEPILEIAE
ncbi:MAG: trehalase [Muriicola sp.]|nr:trehalase [Muriicola sp.]